MADGSLSKPVCPFGVGGRGRAGSAGWGLGCHLRVRALSQGIGARARWRGSPSSPPPPPRELKSCACALVLGAPPAGVGRGRGHCTEGAGSRPLGPLLGLPAGCGRLPRAHQRREGGACLRPFGQGAEAWLPAAGPPPDQRLPFMVITRPAWASFVVPPLPPELGRAPPGGRDLPEVGRAAAAAPGGPAVTTALFCAFVVRHG